MIFLFVMNIVTAKKAKSHKRALNTDTIAPSHESELHEIEETMFESQPSNVTGNVFIIGNSYMMSNVKLSAVGHISYYSKI